MIGVSAVNTLAYNAELCIGCALCSVVCPHGVFAMNGRVARLVRREACMECGACQLNCPSGAIAVESGVGCASAMISAALRGSTEVTCGDADASSCCGEAAPLRTDATPSTCCGEAAPLRTDAIPSTCCGETTHSDN